LEARRHLYRPDGRDHCQEGKAAALFVSLWLRGVSASFADKLMDGFITYLERQESLTPLAEIENEHGSPYFVLTRDGMLTRSMISMDTEGQIMEALGEVQRDEEIVVTFTRRKK
jgi:hypothetical protein